MQMTLFIIVVICDHDNLLKQIALQVLNLKGTDEGRKYSMGIMVIKSEDNSILCPRPLLPL